MQIMGSIQGDYVANSERARMQGLMREFISRLPSDIQLEVKEVAYKIYFWRPFSGAKVDSLIEFSSGKEAAWFARANGTDPLRAFNKALGSLKKIIVEMEFREGADHGRQFKNAI
jgi:hypothetical protein